MFFHTLIKQVYLVFVTIVLFLAAWNFLIIPEINKLPVDYDFYMEHEGEDQIAEHVYGELSQPFRIRETLHQIVKNIDGNIVTIDSRVYGVNSASGDIIFDHTQEYNIDRSTFTHVDKKNELFEFQPDVEKRNYEFFHPLIFAKTTLEFQKTEMIQGLEVFVFTAEVKGDDVSSAFKQFQPHKIGSDTFSTIWVEPITGNLIRFEKHWDDYLVEDGIRKNTVEKGWKRTSEYSEYILADATKTKIEYINLYKVTLPILISSIIAVIGTTLILQRKLAIAKREVIRTEKLALIGELTSRLSHDLRNPLAVIKGNLDLMTNFPNEDEKKRHERLNNINDAIYRISYQINNIMNYIKTRSLQFEKTSIWKILDSALLDIKIPDTVQFEKYGNDVEVECDFQALRIVFINLIINAIQAIEEKGRITIKLVAKNGYAEIKIEDSGPGMSDSIADKIFEPLFTTKQEGTGLGLVSCKNIIEQHGGTISVSNNPTTFTIKIPKNQARK